MKKVNMLLLGALMAAPIAGWSAEGSLPFTFTNWLKAEYDDNVSTKSTDEQDSVKIIESIEIQYDRETETQYFAIRYSPTFTYFFDRDDDETDLHHQAEVLFSQKLSGRTTLRVKDVFRLTEQPELVEDGVTIRNNNDFLYNSVNATLSHQLVPEKTVLRLDGRHAFVAYDEDDAAQANDYELTVAGVDLEQRLSGMDLAVQVRFSDRDYEDDFRDQESLQVGLSAGIPLSPRMQASLRAGAENVKADAAVESDSDNPYASASLVYKVNKDSTATVGVGYAKDTSPIARFSLQERLRGFFAYRQSLTPRISMHLAGSYSTADFDAEDATVVPTTGLVAEGSEDISQFSIKFDYAINQHHSIELAWQFTELDSEVRPAEDFERNRYSLGWKFQL